MRMRFFFFLLIQVVFTAPFLYSQTTKDSLKYLLENTDKSNIHYVSLLNQLAWEIHTSEPDSALSFVTQALVIARKNKNLSDEAMLHYTEGNIYHEKTEYEKSLISYEKAIKYYDTDKKYFKEQIKSHSAKGNSLEAIGRFPEALESFFHCLKTSEEHKDSSGIAQAYSNIAIIYRELKKPDEALNYAKKCLIIRNTLNDTEDIINSYIGIGLIYTEKKELDSALLYYHKTVPLLKQISNKIVAAIVNNNIANVYFYKEDYPQTLKYYFASLEVAEQLNNLFGKTLLTHNIGSVYLKMKDYTSAVKYLKAAAEQSKNMKANDLLKDSYQNLATAYSEMGNYKEAFNYSQLYIELKDTIMNETGIAQIAEMQTKYETEKKQKEIELLNKENEIKVMQLGRQQTITFTVVGGFILALLLSVFIYSRMNIIRNQKKLIEAQKKMVEKQNESLTQAKTIIEEKNKNITDSINYAKRIQEATLPSEEEIKRLLPDSFLFFQPKDIVSGDFYWITEVQGKVFFLVADSTGHGVPGSLMSMMAASLFHDSVIEKKISDPALILDDVRAGIIRTLKQTGREGEQKDGLDASLCVWDKSSNQLMWAGANNPLWYIHNGELKEIKANKQPVGYYSDAKSFTSHVIHLNSDKNKSEVYYLFTDGYSDQFGGEKGKKFKSSNLKKLLLSVSKEPMEMQKKIISETLSKWKEDYEQVDDICIMGVRI
jgi:serine phosphatase RsbU (regulator of sigma subunit)